MHSNHSNSKTPLFYSLAFFLCLSFSTSKALSQGTVDVQANILNQAQASKCMKSRIDFNLKNNVKSILVYASKSTDTLLLQEFTKDGRLINEDTDKVQIHYAYADGILRKISRLPLDYYQDTVTSYYNSLGQLDSMIYQNFRDGESRKVVAHFKINTNWNQISIDYDYHYDISHWDVVLKDEYILKFDPDNRVRSVTNNSIHKEHTYSYTKYYTYHTTNGKVTSVSHRDKAAGSNSALDMHMSIAYNDKKRTKRVSVIDATIRNSLWSYGYDAYEMRNEQGDVIEQSFSKNDDEYYRIDDSALDNAIARYSYTYDENGNWIQKFQDTDSTKTVVSSRLISYY